MIKVFAASAFLALGFGTASHGATLDFNEPGVTGIVGSTVINLSNAVLTSDGADFFIGFGFGETNGNGIACGAAADGSCEADWAIDFSTAATNLMFSSFATASGDFVQVMAYLSGGLLGSVDVATDTLIDFSGFGAIDRLVFDDSSTAAGIGFGDFSFDVATATVPLPATLPLVLFGLGALAVARRRSARAS